MKVMALPRGGQRNIHGPVVCVPSNFKKVTSLPLDNDENLFLHAKLKRKLAYKGYFDTNLSIQTTYSRLWYS